MKIPSIANLFRSGIGLVALAGSLLTPLSFGQDTPRLGDLNGDGQSNVQDISLMVSHLQGIKFLPQSAIPFADLNGDSLLTVTDVEDLVNHILERNVIPGIGLTSILSFSPANGEFDVSPTRETVVRFSMPLSEDTVLDNDNFYATFAGERILSRVELSSDRLKATLFYLEDLPSAARIRATFDGTGLTDFLGRPLSVTGNGSETDVARSDFETLSYAPLINTGVVGWVLASEKDDQGNDVPLAGVIIEVVGDEERTRTTTDSSGSFMLEPVPAGRFFVNVDGRPITGNFPNGGYYPFVGKAWSAVAGRTDNLAGGNGVIYLPYVEPGALKTVSSTEETAVAFTPSIIEDNPELAGTELFVPPNSLFSNNGTRGGMIGIAPVDPARLPEPLPPGLPLPLVITIQTDGATNFDIPVPIRLPNTPDPITGERLPAGAASALWSFNHDTGDWEIAGPMQVTSDGLFLETVPGVGVRQPGWHGQRPGTIGSGGGADLLGDLGGSDSFADGGDINSPDGEDVTSDLDESDSDSDTDTDTDTDEEEDCEEDEEDCEDCEEGSKDEVSFSKEIPLGLLNKWQATAQRIPGVTEAKLSEGKVEGKIATQDCCSDPKSKPTPNGIKEASVGASIFAAVEAKVWGPPVINFDVDIGIAYAEVSLKAGVFINAKAEAGVTFGFDQNECEGKDCAFVELNADLTIALEVKVELKAEACAPGLLSLLDLCPSVDVSFKPVSVSVGIFAKLRGEVCNGEPDISGDIGLKSIVFAIDMTVSDVGLKRAWPIYP